MSEFVSIAPPPPPRQQKSALAQTLPPSQMLTSFMTTPLVIYQLLELKIYIKVCVLSLKRMLKKFLNNFEKIQKTTFFTPKMVRNEP